MGTVVLLVRGTELVPNDTKLVDGTWQHPTTRHERYFRSYPVATLHSVCQTVHDTHQHWCVQTIVFNCTMLSKAWGKTWNEAAWPGQNQRWCNKHSCPKDRSTEARQSGRRMANLHSCIDTIRWGNKLDSSSKNSYVLCNAYKDAQKFQGVSVLCFSLYLNYLFFFQFLVYIGMRYSA
jgi:hypothetical protein